MNWINSSDWNTQARFEGERGSEQFDIHLRGYADEVSVEPVPGPEGNELVVLFRAEAGHTGAAIRVRDILALTLKHYPEMWAEIQAAAEIPPIDG